jgi:hypothetical protein
MIYLLHEINVIVGNHVIWKVGKVLTLLKNITRATYALLLVTNLCLTKEMGNKNKLKGKQWSESKQPNQTLCWYVMEQGYFQYLQYFNAVLKSVLLLVY